VPAPDSREALRRAIAYEHRLYQQLRKHEQLAARWQGRAEMALRRGEQALAGEALQRQAADTRLAEDYQAQYAAQAQAIQRAKQALPTRPISSPPQSAETRLNQLAREDRLKCDLDALKAQLGTPPTDSGLPSAPS